jgi:hypothetical protein
VKAKVLNLIKAERLGKWRIALQWSAIRHSTDRVFAGEFRNSVGKSPAARSTPSIAPHRDGDIQSLFRGVTMTVPRYSLDLSHATVDGDFAACHEAGIIGREKEYRRCDFLGQSEPALRNLADDESLHLRRNMFEATSITDRSGRYGIHTNLSIFELIGPCAGKGVNRRFLCAVDTCAGIANNVCDGSVENDRSFITEQWKGLLCREECSSGIHVECVVKVPLCASGVTTVPGRS